MIVHRIEYQPQIPVIFGVNIQLVLTVFLVIIIIIFILIFILQCQIQELVYLRDHSDGHVEKLMHKVRLPLHHFLKIHIFLRFYYKNNSIVSDNEVSHQHCLEGLNCSIVFQVLLTSICRVFQETHVEIVLAPNVLYDPDLLLTK